MPEERNGYLTPETLAEYFQATTPTVQRLSSNPHCWLRIDPIRDVLELFAEEIGDLPDLVEFERLSVDRDTIYGEACFHLRVDAEGDRYEAYSLVANIVDAMGEGQTFSAATRQSVQSFSELLSKRHQLTPEKERGLIGELLVLSGLVNVLGGPAAIESWLGPGSEEHDFALADFDAEVKTTGAEKRVHVINSATQLLALPNRPLWLVSIQLTRAGSAANSVTLSGLVSELRCRLEGDESRFISYLTSNGWRDRDDELYRTRYLLRSVPTAYQVNDTFPALTRPRINQVVPQPGLVLSISYRVDVSSLDAQVPPYPLSELVNGSNQGDT
ncbi:putative PD-(D/E)XK family protein DUF4420 [Williamsia limnetica]|uniref:Putative PD-(D/E)XK family protein DUF4420 n=1 Tax=Williamsia limnetica TaxID=882452 RepID=A0A318S016_WILLI|nr:putative PD-(D/E)XK family protein DUF4420 [Williamsia limnetica]